MVATTLDPRSALVVIDLQQGVIALPTVHPADEVVKRAADLATAFRRHGLPVVLVSVDGFAPGRTEQPRRGEYSSGWSDLSSELNQQPEDLRITKKTWGAFTNTLLEKELKQRGITQIVIVGIATSLGVESTARHAHELGFNVTFAIDGMTDTNHDAHVNSVTRIFPRLGETGMVPELIELLEKNCK